MRLRIGYFGRGILSVILEAASGLLNGWSAAAQSRPTQKYSLIDGSRLPTDLEDRKLYGTSRRSAGQPGTGWLLTVPGNLADPPFNSLETSKGLRPRF